VQKATKDHKKTADALADGVIVGVGLIKREGEESSK
jgi:tryptophan synthase alpha subunit